MISDRTAGLKWLSPARWTPSRAEFEKYSYFLRDMNAGIR
jgi:hypothetical protein